MNKRLSGTATAVALCIAVSCIANEFVAPRAYRAGQAVSPAEDGTIFCEAEEFTVERPGWQAKRWGENYYAGTFANTFLSRKAFLGAPETCEPTVAAISVRVAQPGRYLVLVRYEAAYRFETQFRVQIEQQGRVRFDRLYGARDNVKIWPFGKGLQKEIAWSWGATENIVWEGHDAWVPLATGPATIRLIAGKQPGLPARRNVDLIMLTRDEQQVRDRIQKERYLPLDGMLTQTGDVSARLVNLPGGSPMALTFRNGTEHSPYWVHLRNWKPISLHADPGETTEWTDVGGLLDTLNDGQWDLEAKPLEKDQPLRYRIEFGLRSAEGQMDKIAQFESRDSEVHLTYQADTRYARRIGTQEQVLYDLLAFLKGIPERGKLPTLTPIYGYTFRPGLSPKYDAAVDEFRRLFHLRLTSPRTLAKTYVDWRGQDPERLEQTCQALTQQEREAIAVVSLGDEIRLPEPRGDAATSKFAEFVRAHGVAAEDVDPASGGDWSKIAYSLDPELRQSKPGLYYWANRYRHAYGIAQVKRKTDVLRRWLPNAGIGANFSPQHGGPGRFYLGEVFQWVNCFRDEGLTLPWSEDYTWGIPIGTPQMNAINLDLFRAGLRGKRHRRILYYVMPHWPGNTPKAWRRMFHNALAHGMTIVNLFEFRPVQAAYTENHVSNPETYATVLETFRELGQYEDIIQSGQRRPAQAALWFSETGDIWDDGKPSFGAAKRALYIAVLHQQVPVDFVMEQDAMDGTLGQYKLLFLTDRHVSRSASAKISDWVRDGGRLVATAGAGMFDEYDQPNTVLRNLLGVHSATVATPDDSVVRFIKQDLPFARAIETVRWSGKQFPVFGAVAQVKVLTDVSVEGTFSDGSPAVITREFGKGSVHCDAFLPGLSYFRPAIPKRPVDRGTTDDSMAHFLPTELDPVVRRLFGSATRGISRPIVSSQPLVEATVIESSVGSAVVLANWTGHPITDLHITSTIPLPQQSALLASGKRLSTTREGNRTSFSLDLDVADVIILR